MVVKSFYGGRNVTFSFPHMWAADWLMREGQGLSALYDMDYPENSVHLHKGIYLKL